MDRPSRKTKVVNYCEAKDLDDDEDFAPPSKKAREDVKQQEHKKSSSKSSSQETSSQSMLNQKHRRPLDEKLYERDLEAAITLSMLNNEDGITNQSPSSKDVKLPRDEITDPSLVHLSNCSVDSSVLEFQNGETDLAESDVEKEDVAMHASTSLDEITAEKVSAPPFKQRKSAINATEEQRIKLKEDEDYQPKLTPDSESDEDFSEADESEDDEFTVKKVIKSKKEKATKNEKAKRPAASKKEKQPSKPPKSHAAASTPVRSHPTAKLAPKKPASSSTVSTSKAAVSLSPSGGRIPKWNPPAQIGKSPTSTQSQAVKSPGQGLRLGLSRLVRVKPLHPSVASH